MPAGPSNAFVFGGGGGGVTGVGAGGGASKAVVSRALYSPVKAPAHASGPGLRQQAPATYDDGYGDDDYNEYDDGWAVTVDPIEPPLKAHGTKRLRLICDMLLSPYALKFSSRRYTMASRRFLKRRRRGMAEAGAGMAGAGAGLGWIRFLIGTYLQTTTAAATPVDTRWAQRPGRRAIAAEPRAVRRRRRRRLGGRSRRRPNRRPPPRLVVPSAAAAPAAATVVSTDMEALAAVMAGRACQISLTTS